MRCTNCNSEVADGMQFCPYCGSPISISMPKVCSKCGTEIEEGEKFCTNCGSPIIFPEQPQPPQQGQPQQPQQGQYQQPYQGQYQQPQQGQYQQPYQGQYQQPYQGQYQQPYQGQYQQSYVQQKPQLPHRPQLTFMEAVNIASHRLREFDGRSRRSEFWWWYLAVCLGGLVLYFVPFLGGFSPLLMFGLLCSASLRRLNDVPAPEWLGKVYLGVWGLNALILSIYLLGNVYDVDFFRGFIRGFGRHSFENLMSGIGFLMFIGSIPFIYYSIKDSNPEIDPMHGPSPKYTL